MLCIVLLTYAPERDHPRAEYARLTITSTLDNLRTTQPLAVHIADDGSPEEVVNELWEIAGGYANVQSLSRTNAERGGYGKSYNLATQQIHSHADFILPLEDDWILDRPLNVDPLIDALTGTDLGCIRLGYIGFTQELRGTIQFLAGQAFLRLDPDSAEPHVFAGHPRLETRDFERRVGPWPEGLAPGQTEFAVAHRPESRRGVAWPLDLGPPTRGIFLHIGTVQARDD